MLVLVYNTKNVIYSPKWLRNKKSTIHPKNYNHKCFQYVVTAALNYQNITYNHPERILKIKPFINQYNWKQIISPSLYFITNYS